MAATRLAARRGSRALFLTQVLIDFGLSYNTTLAEDKAVDLYVLERAITSAHSTYSGLVRRARARPPPPWGLLVHARLFACETVHGVHS